MHVLRLSIAAVVLSALATDALANCGTAACAVSTNWNIQGVPPAGGTSRIDLRYEFIDQSRPWSGTRSATAAGDEEVREEKTLNRNLLATFDHALSDRWTVTVVAPVVSRSHTHVLEPDGAATRESWNFTRLGDARLLGTWRSPDPSEPSRAWGLTGGIKLPTGPIDVANADGARAERSLQPGTGSTDAVFGAFLTRPLANGALWFAQAGLQSAMAIRDGYRPGNLVQATLGYRRPLGTHLTGIVQLNGVARGRDTGPEAENAITGSRALYVSPGASYALTPLADVYAYVQLPVWRNVNGAQLTFDWAALAGVSLRF